MSDASDNYLTRPDGIEALINERELSVLLGVGASTLSRWRTEGIGPRFVVLGPRRLGYRPSDVQRWLADRARNSGTIVAVKVT
jgi:predicted DNA-binding transcriptional regulator AlpA